MNMKTYFDPRLIKLGQGKEIEAMLLVEKEAEFQLDWPAFLGYLDLGSIFEKFPQFEYQAKLKHLVGSCEGFFLQDQLFHFFDQIFVDCLTAVKSIPLIDPHFLIKTIQEKKESCALSHFEIGLFSALDRYEKLLLTNPYSIMHDLILYLAWDRVCLNIGHLFDQPDQNPEAVFVLKECLIESFQHIARDGKTSPGFFRFVETLYAYYLREENLQTHSEEEWQILCQGAMALRSRDTLLNVGYVDLSITNDLQKESESLTFLTLDSIGCVKASLSLVNLLIRKIQCDHLEWLYFVRPMKIICVQEDNQGLSISEVIQT